MLVEVRRELGGEFTRLANKLGVPYSRIGYVSRGSRLVIHGLNGRTIIDLKNSELRRAWREALRL
jgi:phosphoribosylformylglycinamidine (FGAM) synthase-like enzyme